MTDKINEVSKLKWHIVYIFSFSFTSLFYCVVFQLKLNHFICQDVKRINAWLNQWVVCFNYPLNCLSLYISLSLSGWCSSTWCWWDSRRINEDMERGTCIIYIGIHSVLIHIFRIALSLSFSLFIGRVNEWISKRRNWPNSLLLVHWSGEYMYIWWYL